MISYLKGTVAAIQKSSSNRVVVLILDVNQVGYELQIPPRFALELPTTGELVQVFTHQQIREDQIQLYGFASSAERDLFRQLLTVTGIGAKGAIALLDTLGVTDLVQAIVSGNTRALANTPGIGGKTADRLALELKNKLSEWRTSAGLPTSDSAAPAAAILEDVEMTLLALGYSNTEVAQALSAVSQDTQLAKSKDSEDWIRQAISWLSR